MICVSFPLVVETKTVITTVTGKTITMNNKQEDEVKIILTNDQMKQQLQEKMDIPEEPVAEEIAAAEEPAAEEIAAAEEPAAEEIDEEPAAEEIAAAEEP